VYRLCLTELERRSKRVYNEASSTQNSAMCSTAHNRVDSLRHPEPLDIDIETTGIIQESARYYQDINVIRLGKHELTIYRRTRARRADGHADVPKNQSTSGPTRMMRRSSNDAKTSAKT
jgi:hypothetical protein